MAAFGGVGIGEAYSTTRQRKEYRVFKHSAAAAPHRWHNKQAGRNRADRCLRWFGLFMLLGPRLTISDICELARGKKTDHDKAANRYQ